MAKITTNSSGGSKADAALFHLIYSGDEPDEADFSGHGSEDALRNRFFFGDSPEMDGSAALSYPEDLMEMALLVALLEDE